MSLIYADLVAAVYWQLQVLSAAGVEPGRQRLAHVSAVDLLHRDSGAAQLGQQQARQHPAQHLQPQTVSTYRVGQKSGSTDS